MSDTASEGTTLVVIHQGDEIKALVRIQPDGTVFAEHHLGGTADVYVTRTRHPGPRPQRTHNGYERDGGEVPSGGRGRFFAPPNSEARCTCSDKASV